jgi:2-oxoglutarate ferredoxin oxidoreductase subunit delta
MGARTMRVSIDKKYCKGCEICIHVCPKDVFAMSNERQSFGSLIACAPAAENCVGCRLCEVMCPDGCINVEEEGIEK